MNTIFWSNTTLFIYVCISLIAVYGIRIAQKRNTRIKAGKVTCSAGYILMFLAYWLLAILRCTENGYGGVDIGNYLRIFNNSPNIEISISTLFTSAQMEPLFGIINKLIYAISDNTVFYLACIYGVIVIGYIVFIKTYAPKYISYIPLIVLIFPYLKSFCTLRSSFAVAFILIGISIYKKNKFWGWVVVIASFFIHISSFLYIPFLLFYVLYKARLKKMSKYQLITFFVVYIAIVYGLSIAFKGFFGTSVLTGNYQYYSDVLRGNSFIQRIPLYFMQIVLGIVLVIIHRKSKKLNDGNNHYSLKDEENLDFITICCIYDILVIPAAFIFGVWRANEFFYLPRLLMWGSVIGSLKINAKDSYNRLIISMIAIVVACAWLFFRIFREYLELGIMPYILR